MELEFKKTERGFAVIDFKDRYDNDCYIQKSSLATEEAIWLGLKNAKPQVMASKARELGVETAETTGWVPYTLIPPEVLLTTQMHLTQEQVIELLPILQHFAATGELPTETPK